jgi:hypothetical protein
MHVEKNGVWKCGRCSKDFFYNDFNNHRQQLSKQLEEISEWNCDLISKNRQDSIPSVNIIYVTMLFSKCIV